MRYVIIRDDDTNAFTPVECLERLYRPFLNAGLPVNLAVIPEVSLNARMANGQPEGFLLVNDRGGSARAPSQDLYATSSAVLTQARPMSRASIESSCPLTEHP